MLGFGSCDIAGKCIGGENSRLDSLFSLQELQSFDNEGRLVITDHGLFVLLNVYFPNSGDSVDRRRYKMRFHEAVYERALELRNIGRKVIIAGTVLCSLFHQFMTKLHT